MIDVEQRFPMPFRDAVVRKQRSEIGLDPAYVYGLIRQESRFIMDARSDVGASGLMQVMPATARWTAKQDRLAGFTPDQINDRDTNIAIGTDYLKLALDDFDGSMPLAAAAYNAGPGRPRNWRNGPVLEAAIWAENVPFNETRDYVKKVLANATNYAALHQRPAAVAQGPAGHAWARATRPSPSRTRICPDGVVGRSRRHHRVRVLGRRRRRAAHPHPGAPAAGRGARLRARLRARTAGQGGGRAHPHAGRDRLARCSCWCRSRPASCRPT